MADPVWLTLDDIAARLQISVKTLRRILIKEGLPEGAAPLRVGRKLLFSEMAYHLICGALQCPSPFGSVARSGTRVVQSVSGRKQSKSANSALEEVLAMTQRPLSPKKRGGSSKRSLPAPQAGRSV